MSEYIMNRESLKRHCEAMCHKFKDIPTSGTYGEHRLVLELLEQTEWILTSERLPNVGQWVLVTTKDYQKYVEVMCYQGIRIGQHDVGNGWEEYEYPSWTSGHGDVQGHHPKAWMLLPEPYKIESEE